MHKTRKPNVKKAIAAAAPRKHFTLDDCQTPSSNACAAVEDLLVKTSLAAPTFFRASPSTPRAPAAEHLAACTLCVAHHHHHHHPHHHH